MATTHMVKMSALKFITLMVYLLCSFDLYTLHKITNDAKSGSGLCLDFSTGNYCLWTNLVLGSVHYTTKKLFATASFNRSRMLFYNNSCCSFNLPRLKLVGLIHPSPGPTTEAKTNINNSHPNDKPQLNINCLYMNA